MARPRAFGSHKVMSKRKKKKKNEEESSESEYELSEEENDDDEEADFVPEEEDEEDEEEEEEEKEKEHQGDVVKNKIEKSQQRNNKKSQQSPSIPPICQPPSTNRRRSPKSAEAYAVAAARRKRKRAAQWEGYNTDDEDDEQLLPSVARKTEHGGYAHTQRSRARIARANRGNTPWNKGKVRSEADKAKIAAGVRARNRGILLAKLAKTGMTEEEWNEKRKQIKYLREKLRRTKLKMKQEEAEKEKKKDQKNRTDRGDVAQLQLKLDAVLAERDRVNQVKVKIPKIDEPTKSGSDDGAEPLVTEKGHPSVEDNGNDNEQSKMPATPTTSGHAVKNQSNHDDNDANKDDKDDSKPAAKDNNNEANDNSNGNDSSSKSAAKESHMEEAVSTKKTIHKKYRSHVPRSKLPVGLRNLPLTAFQMKWTPHAFDSTPQVCPTGGPGGLVCCNSCAAAFSEYMTQTTEDIEYQRTKFITQEVEEILGYIETTRMGLMKKAEVAKRAPVPAQQPKPKATTRGGGGRGGSGNNSNHNNGENDGGEPSIDDLQLTSPLDISAVAAATNSVAMI